MNQRWIKKCKLTPKKEYKYSVKYALDSVGVTTKAFALKLKQFRVSRSTEKLISALYRGGFGDPI